MRKVHKVLALYTFSSKKCGKYILKQKLQQVHEAKIALYNFQTNIARYTRLQPCTHFQAINAASTQVLYTFSSKNCSKYTRLQPCTHFQAKIAASTQCFSLVQFSSKNCSKYTSLQPCTHFQAKTAASTQGYDLVHILKQKMQQV